MKRFISRGAALLVMSAASIVAAHAEPITFNFTFSSAAVSNRPSGQFPNYHGFSAAVVHGQAAATATGSITFERALLANPGANDFTLPDPAVLALTVTVSNASSGNGTFTLSDFNEVIFDTNGGTLNFNQELVGQPTSEDPWGTPSGGAGGDFNFFIPQAARQQGAALPPNGVFWFTLGADGGNADSMQLTSLALAGPAAAAVPALSPWTLAALAGLLGLMATALLRRIRGN